MTDIGPDLTSPISRSGPEGGEEARQRLGSHTRQPEAGGEGPPAGDEAARIASYYRAREAAGLARRYSLFQRGSLFRLQQFERDVLAALARHELTALGGYRILDVGCGDGGFLRRLVSWGADPRNLVGIELLEARVRTARQIDPCLDVRQGDASALPFEDETFDLAFQLTVFSSILDDAMRSAVATELARVLRPGGAVVSYDFRVARDRRNTRPLRVAELVNLFPGFAVDARRVTLVPPLARALAGRSWLLCELLEAIPPLRTHELVVLRKPTADGTWSGVGPAGRRNR